jgi:hypothetical protein
MHDGKLFYADDYTQPILLCQAEGEVAKELLFC